MTRRFTTLVLAAATCVWALPQGHAAAWQTQPPKPKAEVPTAPAREELSIPTGEQWLGTVRIPMDVLADGERLAAGRYRVRLTGKAADSAAVGQLADLERWVEFVQGGAVKGRAMAPVVPAGAVAQVAESRPPSAGRFKVERLKGDDYLRLWHNHRGDQILIYLPIQRGGAF